MLLAAFMVGVPVVLLGGGVLLLTAHRKRALQAPWAEVARRFGGQLYDGPKVLVHRGTHQLAITLDVVSVMQALGGGYPDGGTFSVVRLAFDPSGPHRVAGPLKRMRPAELAVLTGVSAFAELPSDALVTIAHRDARVVMRGAVADGAVLAKAMDALGLLADQIVSRGPVALAA